MQIRVLGHVEASVDGRPVELGGAKARALLAMLGLEANRPVPAERLIAGLWGEQPPASATKMVQNYVWRVRRVLADHGGAEIVTRGPAYELRIDRERVDACRLERLLAEAARAADAGRPSGAAREALALFFGAPLADVADEPFAAAEIRRFEEMRLTAAELAIDADLAGGHAAEVVPEIDGLLAENPLRERLHAQRMLALYRSGRQAEALEAYRTARRTLVEQIGVEPGPELRRLHDAILRQDPALDAAPVRAELPPELAVAGAPRLVGRAAELRRLRALWRRGGGLVTLAGEYGMGKTRLAAELAGEAFREGASVAYVAGNRPAGEVLRAISRAREMAQPALVVVDDADRSPAAAGAALRELAGRPAVLVLATGAQAAALARLQPSDALVLGPLDAAGVAAIGGAYTPEGGGEPPVDELLEASRGVPRLVHELAGEWARREATRRVEAAAGRAAAGRREVRALEAELVGSVADLQATRARVTGDGSQSLPMCPYKGLAAFGGDDASYFFGRERLVAELVARLVGASLLAVVGPSGVGKSSVVRAGLLPALAGGVLPGSQSWVQAVIRPGARPLEELRRARRRLEREWRGLLVVDQLEELFTAGAAEAERRAFADALVRAARERRAGGVVLVVRADFYGRCSAYPELAELMGANHVLVGPMSREELERAIERPAERAGLTVEARLVEALVGDVVEQPGALPLLSTALLELWRERDGRHLRLAAYVRSGGVEGAVARLAEDAYRQLDAEHQTAARRLLLRLADEDAGSLLVRRRIPLADADSDLVATLADQRLLTIDDGTVEVAHEALLREWPRLRGWLDEDAQGRRLRRRLATAAQAWQAGEGELYRGMRLSGALDWAAGHGSELSADEQAFLEAGRRAATRAQHRLRAGLAGALALALLAITAGLVAVRQRADERAQATAAEAQSLGSAALAERDVAKALLLARQGVALRDSPDTQGNLLATLLKTPDLEGVVPRAGAAGLALSPDGRTLVTADGAGDVRFFAATTRRQIARRQVSPLPVGADGLVSFSADGRRLVVGGSDPEVIATHTRRVLAALVLPDGSGEPEQRLTFSRDGRVVLAVVERVGLRPALVRFATRTGDQLGASQTIGRAAVMLTPDGRLVTSRDGGSTVIRDRRTLRPLRRITPGATHAALSPDGHTVLLGGADGSVRFLDLRSGRVRVGSGRHEGRVTSLAFSADGRTAATGGDDDRVIAWDVARAASTETLIGHTAAITDIALSPDGRTLYSAGLDDQTLVWDLSGTRRLDRPFAVGGPSGLQNPFPQAGQPSYALSGDGRLLVVGHRDGTVTVVDAHTLRFVRRFRPVPAGPVLSLAFLPRGGPLAVGGPNGFLALVDARRGTQLQQLRGESGDEIRISPSADGTRMATLSMQGTIALWTLRRQRAVEPPTRRPFPDGAGDLSLSPDGRTLALASPRGVRIADAFTLRLRATLRGSQDVVALGPYTPDGRYVVGGGPGGARMWSTATLRPATSRLAGDTGAGPWTAVSPNGRMLATGGMDGAIRLYDLPSQRPLGAPLPAAPNHPAAPLFSPDGAYLYAITDTPRAYRWDVRPAAWEARACAVAARTLSRAEWADALPGRPYAPACAG